MELTKFLMGFILVFIVPQLITATCLDSTTRLSLKTSSAFAFSLVSMWIYFLFDYAFGFPRLEGYRFETLGIAYISASYIIFYRLTKKLGGVGSQKMNSSSFIDYSIVICATILFLIPLKSNIGLIFTEWDAIVSWNQWAVDMYNRTWVPTPTAYPVGISAMWSIFYQIQGTSDIWWTVKLLMFIFPGFLFLLMFSLYRDTKDFTYFFVIAFSLPIIWWEKSLSGYMDVPVALMGITTLSLIYASESSDNSYLYLIIATLFAGFSAIIKQAGLTFCIFTMIYILLFYRKELSIKVRIVLLLLSLSFIISFLIIFFNHNSNPLENFDYLSTLSYGGRTKELDISITSIFNQSVDTIKSKFIYINDGHRYLIDAKLAGYIVMVMLATSILFVFVDLPSNKKRFAYMLAIFSIIGLYVWLTKFSYDYRNGLWVKSFFVMSSSLILGRLLHKVYPISQSETSILECVLEKVEGFFSSRVWLTRSLLGLGFVSALLFSFYLDGKGVGIQKQIIQQEEIDDPVIAVQLENFLESTDDCVVVYTNRLMLPYNFHLNKLRHRVIEKAWFTQQFEPHFYHNCRGGRYFVFGPWTKSTPNAGWEIIEAGEESGLLTLVGVEELLIYYVQPSES
ncbi:TPA: hypothetical protein AB5B17_002880 [Vibrio mimicus]